MPRPDADLPSSQNIPPPSANARRSLAAERIVSSVRRDNLSPVPFVPYAVSLALSVEYRKMRHCRLPMFRTRARAAFKSNCELLRLFRDVFWSARVVADLGEKVLREMERTASSLANERSTNPIHLPAEQSIATPDFQNAGTAVTSELAVLNNDVLDLGQFDFAFLDSMPDLDVFGYFDPNFNLDAVDNVLSAHLDIGQPQNWIDWEHAAG
jgi:hypothetical protein